MRKRQPHPPSPDEIHIRREGDTAIIEYADDSIMTTHIRFGDALATMTDDDIIEYFRDSLEQREEAARLHDWTAIEVPAGRPQLRPIDTEQKWSPRGHVLRCTIDDGGGEDGTEAVICIDDKELSMQEFGKMLTVFAGWGMRIVIVPEEDIYESPTIEVRDPVEEPSTSE